MQFDESSIAHRYADLAGVRLHYVEAGAGPLVVLLHGFPEHWYGWRHQIPALAAAGFRVVAPDLRGYNLSDKPRGIQAYGPDALAGDVAGLITACGETRAHVVGHDWGAGVAWLFAMANPKMLDRLALLNGPHPASLLRALKKPRQLARSWYMFFFQLPWLPELALRVGDHAMLRRSFTREPVRPGAFDADDLARYTAALGQPGALTAMINYYRAAARAGAPRFRRIDTPVLSIWGERDPHLLPELARPDPSWVPSARVERLPDASHWVQHDQPERVNELLIAFLRGRERVALHGIRGRPFLSLEPHLDLGPLAALHEEICLGLTCVPVDYTGGSHRSMGIVPPSLVDEPWIDYGEVIRAMSLEAFRRFRDLSDDPDAIDVERRGELEFGEERDHPLSRRQMLFLKYRHGVYFPWKVYYELIPNTTWVEKSQAEGKSFTREARTFFPKTIAYLRSLPFESIGRANLMGLEANDFGTVHRDGEAHEEKAPCHFITLCPAGNKRLFLWDEARREKTHVPGRAYWFNDCDYHGVEADPFFRYSLRVDGVFRADFLETLRAAYP